MTHTVFEATMILTNKFPRMMGTTGKLVRCRLLGPTAHRGARFRCQVDGFPYREEHRSYDSDVAEDAVRAAVRYVTRIGLYRVDAPIAVTYCGQFGNDYFVHVGLKKEE